MMSRSDEYNIMFSETVIIAIELRDKFVQFYNYATSPDGRYVISIQIEYETLHNCTYISLIYYNNNIIRKTKFPKKKSLNVSNH